MRNFVQEGRTLTIPAPAGGLFSGSMVKVGALFGVAAADAAEGDDVAVSVEGVFALPKAAADAVALGDALHLSADGVLTRTGAGNARVGYAAEPAAAGTVTVIVKLTPGAA